MSQKNAQDHNSKGKTETADAPPGAPPAGLAALAPGWDALSGTLPFQVPFATASSTSFY